jgi:16S rRNA (cytosine967-C5)-methyltransferase
MTPAARLSAAIEVLDRVLDGHSVDPALTGWSRGHRFAGSGDRAALRDLVFDALRCRRSFAALGGGLTGRGLILGGVRAAGGDEAALFNGVGHAPVAVGPADAGRLPEALEALDCPEWLAGRLQAALGDDFPAVMQALRKRAPVFLRVNRRKASVAQAVAALEADGIAGRSHPLASFTLEIMENARKIQTSGAYADGLVELQDAASQAVVQALPLRNGTRVLDYCAGGGGKTLAMAAAADVDLWAHDAHPRRMVDLPVRAARAGVKVTLTETPVKTGPYDLILTDVPCSGSGSWRRDPMGKWTLTGARLIELIDLQAKILDQAAALLAPGGTLAYATCSMLTEENDEQIARFLTRHRGWSQTAFHHFSPLQGGDGFFVALLTANRSGFTKLEGEQDR